MTAHFYTDGPVMSREEIKEYADKIVKPTIIEVPNWKERIENEL